MNIAQDVLNTYWLLKLSNLTKFEKFQSLSTSTHAYLRILTPFPEKISCSPDGMTKKAGIPGCDVTGVLPATGIEDVGSWTLNTVKGWISVV